MSYTPRGATFSLDFDNGDGEFVVPVITGTIKPAQRKEARVGPRKAAKADRLLALRPTKADDGDVLIVNSYAGSLVLAARSLGRRILASCEDAAYGLEVQQENFPELEGRLAGRFDAWPDRSLERTVVFSHPPCAAFSSQQKKKRSIDNAKFAQSMAVMRYALARRTPALLVESVVATMEGARAFHDQIAEEHGYWVYRVLQNAATFGIPQWRPRFWCVFLRKDVRPSGVVRYRFKPDMRPIGELVHGPATGPGVPDVERRLERNRRKTIEKAGLTLDQTLACERGELGYGRWWKLVAKAKGMKPDNAARLALAPIFSRFEAVQFHVCDPARFSPTLMKDSLWLVNGRPPTADEYKRAMGYPSEYRLPADPRAYLSRGVCPPVAEWVLRTATSWVENDDSEAPLELRAGGVADLRPPNDLR